MNDMFITTYLNGVHWSLLKIETRLYPTNKGTPVLPTYPQMKYDTVEDVISSLPHPVLPSVTGEPDYRTIHAIHKMIRANACSINTHLGGE
jgi:hypothetical protein